MAKETGSGTSAKKISDELMRENEELRDKVRELEETLDAIRSGEVDAIVVTNGEGRKVFTLEGADHPYRTLVENIQEGALTLSRTGTILYTNARFAGMSKLPADKIAGTSLLDFVCPDYRTQVELALKDILKRSCRSRVRLRQAEKGSLPVLISMHPLSNDEETKISVVVTDRRRDEDKIQLQARMLDAVGDAVIAADTKNKIVYWNEAATKTYGWTAEEAIGRDLIEVTTPKISHKEAREIASQIARGKTWAGEYIVHHKDGHEFSIYASDAPIFDDDGKLIAIVGASHDITGQKQTERDLAERNQDLNALNEDLHATHKELRQTNEQLKRVNESLSITEEELRNSNDELIEKQLAVTLERDRVKNLLDIAGVMIIALDTIGKVTLVNRRGCEILGRPEEEIVGKDWVIAFIPPEIREEIKRALRRVLNGESEEFRSHENPVLARDGEKRQILWSNALIRDGSGRITGLLSSGEDITDRKKSEESLQNTFQRFYRILAGMPYGLLLVTDDDRVEFANQAFCDIFGFKESPAELSELSAEEMMEKIRPAYQDPEKSLARIREIVRRGQPVSGEDAGLTSGRVYLRDFMPIRVGEKSYGRLWLHIDITDRKQAEDKLLWHNEMMHGINGILEAGLTTGTEKDLGMTCLEIAERITESKFGFVGEINDQGLEDIAISNPGWDACNIIDAGGHRSTGRNFKIHGIFGRVIKDGKSLITNDPSHHPARIGLPKGHPPLESFLGVPLIHQEKVIGMIAVANRPGGYSNVEQESLEALAPAIVEAFMRKRAEDELKRQNNALTNAYEKITVTQEALRENVTVLLDRERQLNESLAEKEILLSEIHHRVKNNLTAFISLLSLEGSYEETPAGTALKKDLQNRARTMALIHETLYKTHQFAEVDMELYLTTLVDQVVSSYSSSQTVKTLIDAKGITLDLARATPLGLIVNELVTNSLKYAFPKGATSDHKGEGEVCTIGIRIARDGGEYVFSVSDNGIGLPADFDLAKTQSLGLKLVNFLSRHQLRSKPVVNREKGTEFVFRFKAQSRI